MSKIKLVNVFKIFGPQAKSVLPMLKEENMTKEKLFAKTGHTVGVNNVSLEIQEGELFVIMGLSGSGKSTLIRCFNLLNQPTGGSIIIDDKDIAKVGANELKK